MPAGCSIILKKDDDRQAVRATGFKAFWVSKDFKDLKDFKDKNADNDNNNHQR